MRGPARSILDPHEEGPIDAPGPAAILHYLDMTTFMSQTQPVLAVLTQKRHLVDLLLADIGSERRAQCLK